MMKKMAKIGRLCNTIRLHSSSSIKVGSKVSEKRVFSREDVQKFCQIIGDTNPVHFDDGAAQRLNFSSIIVPGLQLNGTVASIIGSKLPGPGSILVKQFLDFVNPCYIGEQVETTVWISALKKKFIECQYECIVHSSAKVVMKGNALIYKPVIPEMK
ncbi:hydroxyacyl-thioester dehydratase type 2, mitochondrial-like [Tetranychus urticae]|uniref:MaoC-like domain-containing protein n=1 Tax=Tetranychus urticae TaxID=32264 RepID=T1L1X1_TETUR|nr:hydroxyacyl-thioester dehydratase type 2, mitochondrial-like [Tetranychus urticae]